MVSDSLKKRWWHSVNKKSANVKDSEALPVWETQTECTVWTLALQNLAAVIYLLGLTMAK